MDNCTDTQDWRFMDPDISGPGVRVSFYLQTFFLVVLVNRSWQDAPIALWTCIAMSFGLTVAVLANFKSFMTLLEVLQVCNLVWLANIGIFVSLASYSRQKAGSRRAKPGRRIIDYKVKFGAMFQTLFSMVLTVAMWSRIEDIGRLANSNEQDEVRYVFFVWATKATGTAKFVGLALSSLLLALYTILSLREMYSFCCNRRRKASKDKVLISPLPTELKQTASHSPSSPIGRTSDSVTPPSPSQPRTPLANNPPTSDVEGVTGSKLRRPRRRRWTSHNLDPMFVGILIIELLVWTYFVVSCEKLIVLNDANDGEALGFGQIVALAVVTPSLLSMVSAIRENGFGRLSGKKKDHRKSRSGNRSRRQPNGVSEVV
ncbi:hypothetical protein PM082_003247 [Marasmius tenuissimus]|nr:hypothetical protein PM082_003247 [Marasmius tenuissimus]